MATNGAQEAYAPGDVLAALTTMRGSEQDTKKRAHEFLEGFQKSVSRLVTWFAPFTPPERVAKYLSENVMGDCD